MIHLNSFIKRQSSQSKHSHWECSDEELMSRINSSLNELGKGNIFPGYRDGVILVKISPVSIKSAAIQLHDGDLIAGAYQSRKVGETPRKSYHVVGKKQDAQAAFVVLYSHAVLLEGKENETEADWEAICLIATPDDASEPPPMDPDTLMANHFGDSGGTKTLMSDAEFAAELSKSYFYWRDKAMCSPQ
jgi:hypothetical protein